MRFAVVLLCCFLGFISATKAETLLQKGDTVCLIGNALGERMQHHNAFETLICQSHPDLQLTFRNLCFPGDEPFERIRSLDFGDPDKHLAHSKADVVMMFFGFNESFDGAEGLEAFQADMTKLVQETLAKNYSGEANARIILVSPIAFEDIGNPNVPTGQQQNENLALYTTALKEVATATNVGFVDLFTPTKAMFADSESQYTLNGAHLNAVGYQALAPEFVKALGLSPTSEPMNARLKAEIDDKNFHWWHRYRAVNGYSIYGKRGLAGKTGDGKYNNRDVMERERAILDQMAANRDVRIHAIANGESVADKCDDSNTLPFLDVVTNVGGKDDPNRKRGKLGSLSYLSAAEQQELFELADGYEIQLVASEEDFPELANPVAINFDSKGRLWVSTMQSYPHWQPKSELNDKLLILEDNDHDGKADKCIVFAEGLHQPTGFELGQGGAYVAQQPDILFLKDTNGDDKADVSIRQLVGFGSADSHHGISAFEWSPGGHLHFNEGTFKYSQIEGPHGLTRMHEAGIWLYNPRTEYFGTFVSLPFANPWGHVFDRWGQSFIADASPGRNYWATPISGKVEYPAKHAGGPFNDSVNNFKDTSLRGKDVYPPFFPKRTRPSAGNELISSRHFKPEDQGDYLLCNVIGDRSILQHSVTEESSGFKGKEKPQLVFCKDGNFRPIDIQFAPDGSLYICDWHQALIGHLQHNLREPNRDHQHGRIWRVTCKDRPLVKPVAIAGESTEAVLQALTEYEDRTRYRARRELAARDTKTVVTTARQWLTTQDTSAVGFQHLLMEINWVLQSHNVVDQDLLQKALNADDYHCRSAATRLVSDMRHKVPNALGLIAKRIADDHPQVRLEAVRACSFFGEEAIEVALEVLNHDVDDHIQYTLNETMRHLENL